jgi:hypothetical protein
VLGQSIGQQRLAKGLHLRCADRDCEKCSKKIQKPRAVCVCVVVVQVLDENKCNSVEKWFKAILTGLDGAVAQADDGLLSLTQNRHRF